MNLDIFNNDAFKLTALTAAINNQPATPRRLATLGLFAEESVATTSVWIEQQNGSLRLVQTSERGAPSAPGSNETRTGRGFKVPHLRVPNSVKADEIQNVRAFGSETELETIQAVVNKKLAKDRRDLEATQEYHRIGAIKGVILDADATSVIYDLYDEFDIVQVEVDMHLDDDATDVRVKTIQAKRESEDALGDAASTGYRVFCGRAFFDALIGHPEVKDAYKLWNGSEMLRNDPRGGFMFGDVIWEEYRGKVGSTAFIGDDEAYLVPEGVADLFVTYFAPADYVETANTLGLPFYAKQEPMPMGRGVALESQSNPLSICTRPGAIIKLNKIA